MTRRVYVAIDPTDPPTDGEAVVYQSSSDSYIGSALGDAHDRSHDHSDSDDGDVLDPAGLSIPTPAGPIFSPMDDGTVRWHTTGAGQGTLVIGTGLGTDVNIGGHDGTTPSTQAFGDSADAGSGSTVARADHKHAMPADPTAGYGDVVTHDAADFEAAGAIASHAGDDDAHHARYEDSEAVSAMGALGDANPLNHAKYTDAEAVSATAAAYEPAGAITTHTGDDDAHHAKYTDAEAVTAAKTVKLDDLTAPDDNTDLDASTSKHGLLPKLSNDDTEFLDGTGAFAVPSMVELPHCLLRRSSAYLSAHNTSVILDWDAEALDSHGFHSDSTNPSRMTIPAGLDGLYFVHGIIKWSPASTPGYDYGSSVEILLNGTVFGDSLIMTMNAAGTNSSPFFYLVGLGEGDYLQTSVIQTSSQNVNVYGHFGMFRIAA